MKTMLFCYVLGKLVLFRAYQVYICNLYPLRPFANYNSGEIQQIYEKYLNNNLDIDNYIKAIKIKNCMPVLEYAIVSAFQSKFIICLNLKMLF